MLIRQFGSFPSPRCPFQESFLDEERLIDFLDRAGIFTESRCDGRDAHRPSAEFVDNREKNFIVDFVQSVFVDVQRFQGKAGNRLVDGSVALHLSEIANATQKRVADSRRPPAAGSNFFGSAVATGDVQNIGRAFDDIRQRFHIIILQMQVDAETGAKSANRYGWSRQPV